MQTSRSWFAYNFSLEIKRLLRELEETPLDENEWRRDIERRIWLMADLRDRAIIEAHAYRSSPLELSRVTGLSEDAVYEILHRE